MVDRRRRRVAQAMKACLENIAQEACDEGMLELAHMVSVAALAAEEVARGREELQPQQLLAAE